MKKKTFSGAPPVFLYDILLTGYGMARAFLREGIEVVGFLPKEKCYESSTRLPIKLVDINYDESEQLQQLLDAALAYDGLKPVLILTSDNYQSFVSAHYDLLKQHFLFEIPKYDTLKHFLEKDLFIELARKHQIQLPPTFEVTLADYREKISDNKLGFPLVIKPKYKHPIWKQHFNDLKVLVATSHDELRKICEEVLPKIDTLVVQEWIHGNDSNIYYCLAYVTEQGKVLDYFCGQKIHQYPILLGNTSSSIACNDPYVIKESLRILTLPGIFGFCSVEFKKDMYTGQYYVIEPTIGRADRQEYTALTTSPNLALTAYSHLTGINAIDRKSPKQRPIFLIEEFAEVRSIIAHIRYGGFNWSDYLKLISTHKVRFAYLNHCDPILSLRVFISAAMIALRALIKPQNKAKRKSTQLEKLYPKKGSK